MDSLRELTTQLSEAVATSEVEGIIRSLLDRFFREHALPTPRLKFVNKLSARYLARCKWHAGDDNTEIEIQKSILGDEETLRRVLTHELIHHWQFLRTDQATALSYAKLGLKLDGHGQDFEDYAAKINAVLGAGYVTKTSDQSYDTAEVPPYYVLVQPHGTRFGFSVALRPSAAQKAEIENRRAQYHAKLFRITDGRFTKGVPIKKFGGYVAPKDKPAHDEFLKNLYNTGQEVFF